MSSTKRIPMYTTPNHVACRCMTLTKSPAVNSTHRITGSMRTDEREAVDGTEAIAKMS